MLKINNPTASEAPEQSDVVGRFRSGFAADGEPHSLSAFRITTGDPKLAKAIAKEFGIDKAHAEGPQEWEAVGEDYLEVFTTTKSVNIILESADSYKASLTRRTKDGDFMYSTDGEVITAVGEDYEDEYSVGDPNPQADQDIETLKAKAKKGLGASPDIKVSFTIEGHEDWGTFMFRTGGWSLVYNSPEEKLHRLPAGPIKAVLKLTEVEGKKFSWTKPELIVRGSANEDVVVNDKPTIEDTPF